MFESINIHSSISVYAQIENHVQFGIASGNLEGGDQLPTVSALATKLGVNMNTVAKAYRDLEVMGLVFTRRGMGVFVNKGVESKCRQQCHKHIVERMREVVAEAKAAGMTAKEVKKIVSKSVDSEVGPYGETPAALLALAKAKP